MFISRDKFQSKFTNYKDQFDEQKSKQIKNFLGTTIDKKAEEAKDENPDVDMDPVQPELTKA